MRRLLLFVFLSSLNSALLAQIELQLHLNLMAVTNQMSSTLAQEFEAIATTFTIDMQEATCVTSAGNDGAIEVTLSGGTAPYTYIWNDPSLNGIEDPTGLSAGTYALTVIDALACESSASIELGDFFNGEMPVITICEGQTVQLSPLVESSQFLYLWEPAAGLSCTTCPNPIVTTNTSATYTLTTILGSGCISIDTAIIIVDNEQPVIVNFFPIAPNCNGGADGGISFEVICGTPPFQVELSNGTNLSFPDRLITITDLPAGSFSFTITDANNNTTSTTGPIIITDPETLIINAITIQSTCGFPNGAIDITTISGGCPPYTYSWSNGVFVEDPTGLAPGNYTITVTDCKGCTEVGSYDVTTPNGMIVSITNDQCALGAEANGTVDVDVMGGTPPYMVEPDPNALAAGTYNLTITDADGCTVTTSAILSAIDASVPKTIFDLCFGDSTQLVVESPQSLNYSWTNSDDLSCLTCPAPFVNPSAEFNEYTVSIDDPATGCSSNWTFAVNVGDCVWPGDTDTNRLVNHFDLLNIGLGYATNGALRSNASLDWIGQPASNWPQSSPISQVNYKHIDADGNGQIGLNDLAPIILNWGESYLIGEAITANRQLIAPFYVQVDTFYEGESVSLPLILGDTDNPAEDIYGLAFSIEYDSSLIKENSVALLFNPSWMGVEESDFIQVQKDFYSPGRLDVAISRIDGQNISGMGEIAQLFITIEDDILLRNENESGRFAGEELGIDFKVSNVRLINNSEVTIELEGQTTTSLITTISSKLIDPSLQNNISIFPNPTSDQLMVTAKNINIDQVSIFSVTGKQVLVLRPASSFALLSLANMPQGSYMIQLQTEAGLWSSRFVIIH